MVRFVDTVVVAVVLFLTTSSNAYRSLRTSSSTSTSFLSISGYKLFEESSSLYPTKNSKKKKNDRHQNVYMTSSGSIPSGPDNNENENEKGNKNENGNNKPRFPYSPDITDNTYKTVSTYNWKYGLCAHKIVFEATETIKKMRFCGDLLGK